MSDEVNGPDAYRNAQAEAKAAAARARALRPWYKKKRFILGIPLGAFVALAVIGALTSEEPAQSTASPSTSGRGASSLAAATETQRSPGIGDIVSVGSLDLTIVAFEPYDASQHNMFNSANARLHISATNARGDASSEYNLSALYFKVVDSNGIAHSATFACASCPDEVSNVDLVRGGRVEGYVYFELPAGRPMVEVIYEPLFSTNKARVRLQ